jgi:hypothetical protein
LNVIHLNTVAGFTQKPPPGTARGSAGLPPFIDKNWPLVEKI